ncbi:MAG: VWA domain-containing protein [Spirochaetaceae bacterium]|nr:VWA domain-containing protein [Spirochaetaceae bacterium]
MCGNLRFLPVKAAALSMGKAYRRFFHLLFLLCPVFLAAQASPGNPALAIGPEDLRIEQRVDGGFHLFIRKKPGIASVLLTESTRDPALRSANYAYRAPEWNPVNGDEIRLLDERPLPKSSRVWSLIDSTPEVYGELGEAFHIYIPYILNYGYETTRHGEVYVVDGTYFNIRAFSLPYADYRGSFRDNPFILEVTQQPLPGPPGGNYMKETEDTFSEISAWSRGDLVYSAGPADLVDKIRTILDRERGKTMDLVICLDTTGSMKDDITEIRKNLVPMLKDTLGDSPGFRIGLVLYKDYYEEYLTKTVPFTSDMNQFQRAVNSIIPRGGKDIPEAVYEALYEGTRIFPWEAESRLIILIGDAPPHIRQRGKISKEMVREAAETRNIRFHAIILPQ